MTFGIHVKQIPCMRVCEHVCARTNANVNVRDKKGVQEFNDENEMKN